MPSMRFSFLENWLDLCSTRYYNTMDTCALLKVTQYNENGADNTVDDDLKLINKKMTMTLVIQMTIMIK